jgi:DNA-binding Lrp family transcriptional regulator
MEKMKNEVLIILKILKNPEIEYNSNNLSKTMKITSMGVLKILKKLKENGILVSRKIGNASIHKINWQNDYAVDYVKFLLKEETENALPYLKKWINEIKKIDEADVSIIFGSIINENKSKDVDVLFVINDKKLNESRKKIEEVNKIKERRIHPIYQSLEELKNNIEKNDEITMKAIKGIIAIGHEKFVELISKINHQNNYT